MPYRQPDVAQTWNADQVLRVFQNNPELATRALQQVLVDNEELQWSLTVGLYLDEEVNLSKAAELLSMHPLALRERFIELGIPLRSGPADIPEAIAEVRAARRWVDTDNQSANS